MRGRSEKSDPADGSSIALILLAAGASTRLGQPKQLLPFRGRSLLRHAAETALATVCHPVVVVLGAGAEVLQTELAGLPVVVAVNRSWSEGMASSLRAGLEAASEPAEPGALVIMLCDQPLITGAMLNRLVATHHSEKRGIVACAYGDTLGVPALFSRPYFSELRLLEGDQGARKIIVKHKHDVAQMSLPEAAFDVDHLEEAARLGTAAR